MGFRTACLGALAAAALPLAAQAADLSLRIEGARNAAGVVAVCLWVEPRGFPDCGASRTAVRRTVPAADLSRPILFEGLRPGTFAVSALHDENADGRLDTNLLGIPREGIAVSSDRLPKFSAPRYGAAAFELTASAERTIRLVYR